MYGGRAIDSFDRRILNVYMDEYLGDFLFDKFQPFHFFHTKDIDYKIPPCGLKEAYVGQSLPIFPCCKNAEFMISVITYSLNNLIVCHR